MLTVLIWLKTFRKALPGEWFDQKICFASVCLCATFSVAQATTVTFASPGSTTWTAPAGVTSVTVDVWGGGGAGGGATLNPSKGGGGAGGQYARKVLTVTPGNAYTVVVGAGGTGITGDGVNGGDSTFAATSVVAKGGAGGTGAANGVAGAGSSTGGVGDLVYAGGDGSSGSVTGTGGAGGGGAGSTGSGGAASDTTAGTGTAAGGGSGGAGLTSRAAGNPGSAAGGGGGGGYKTNATNRAGGVGGRGQVVLTYAFPTVSSINRASYNPAITNTDVSWNVVFSTSVTGVDATDFVLLPTGGVAAAAITSVVGSGTIWTVTATSGTGPTGTLGLNLVDNNSVQDSISGMMLGGIAAGDGSFSGQIYTIALPAPALAKTASASSAVVGDVVTFAITANNPYGVGLANVVLSDVLPAGMAYSTHVVTLGAVAVSGQNVSWTIPSLPAGGSAQLTLAVSLTAQGSLTNTVTSPGAVSASASILVLANAITHFRMDEPVGSWSGVVGEVLDSGGTRLHGQRLTTSTPTATNTVLPSPTIASQYSSVVGGFCNAGRFDGTAVVAVADSPLFDYTTQLSASAWIYPTAYPTGDLYSILSNDVNYEFHLDTNGRLFWWWNASTLTSSAIIPLNQWTHIAITFSSSTGAGRQRIYINGVADTNTNSWTGTLAANACPFYIGGDIGTGAACGLIPGRNFRGLIDEVKLYNLELGAAEVQADMNLGRSCSGTFDHLRIEHDAVASICLPETVTVKACLDAACSTLYTGNVTARLSPAGWVGGDTFSFSGGITSRQLSYGTAGNVVLGSVSVSPGPTNATRCFKGATETCSVNFAASSCSFDAVEPGANPQTRLFTKLSNVPFNVDVLALLNPTAVNTGYTGPVAVDLVDASTSACPTGTGLNTATNISYAPAADSGRKTVTFTYPKAARNVRVRATVGASAPACSTDSFTVRPQSFSAVYSSANADATGVSATATPVVKAGSVFSLGANTGVVGYDGLPKANPALLEWANTPPGGRMGVLDGSTPTNLSFLTAAVSATGNAASGDFAYDEAGYFRFKVNGVYDDTFPTDSGDKAGGDCVVGGFSNTPNASGKYGCNFGNVPESDYLGRFVPDHFDTAVTQACVAGVFTYSGQPFPLQITARSFLGGVTQNYSGAFAKATTLAARDIGDTATNPGPGLLAPTIVTPVGFAAGVADLTPAYTFTSPQTAQTNVRIRAAESEVSSLRTPAAMTTEGAATILSGRARLASAYGSELLDLPMSFRTESWSGAGWVLNALDTCTGNSALSAANAVSVALVSSPAGLTCIYDSGSPGLSGAGCAGVVAARSYREGATPSVGFAGDFNLWLRAPGANQFGRAVVTATVPTWLGPVPPTIATFGRYKTPLIYRRENY